METVFVPIDARTDPRYLYVKNNPLYKDFFEGSLIIRPICHLRTAKSVSQAGRLSLTATI